MNKAKRICSWRKPLCLMLWLALSGGSVLSQIQTFQTHPAERVMVVEKGGGYFPVICKMKDGEILAVLRGGGPHKFSWGKARLDIVRSSDGGQTWTQPVTVADYPDRDEENPALGQLSDGTVVLAFWSYKGTMEFESYDALKALQGKLIFTGILFLHAPLQGWRA
ncbi:MAG: exo-alpha-sialidase [Acidobacteria bacterium]|nr:exo-alpha-sialidase [Acidobacteriota bacterium]